MTVTLSRAAADDAATLSALAISTYTEAFGDSYPPHDLHDFLQAHYSVAPQRAELNDPLNAAWLLRVDDTAVGYLAAGPNGLPHPLAADGDIELKRLYVLSAHQNAGHGVRLMEAFLEWLDTPARRTLWVGVWSENHGAQRFYARYGCSKVGEYDFIVGASADREHILRRPVGSACA